MLKKETSYTVFRVLWVYLLVINIADFRSHSNLDLIPFIHFSELPLIKYIPFVIAVFFMIPLNEFITTIRKKRNLILILTAALLILAALLSSFYSDFPETAFKLTSRYFFYFLIFITALTAVNYYNKAGEFIIRSFIYVNILVIAGSLLDYYSPAFHTMLVDHFDRPEAKHSVLTIGNTVYMRPMGFLTDTNLTAFSVGLSLMMLLLNRKHFNPYFTYSFYAAASYVLGLLASRASILICIALTVFFFIIIASERKHIAIFFVFFIVFQLFTPQIYVRIISAGDKNRMETEMKFGRTIIWKAALDQFADNPVIGSGPGNFFEHSQKRIRAVIFRENPGSKIDDRGSREFYEVGKGNPHNLFLAILCELGLAGFILFIFLLLYLAVGYARKKSFITLAFFFAAISVSFVSNFAPYYRYYLLICIILYSASAVNMKIMEKQHIREKDNLYDINH